MNITTVGCSRSYRDSVLRRMAERSQGQSSADGETPVILIQCDSEEHWSQLAIESRGDRLAVAVLPAPTMENYVRALTSGASGIVTRGTPSGMVAEIVESASHGNVILPRAAAHGLARSASRRTRPSDMSDADVAVLRALASGKTVVDLARDFYFSERTVRRHLKELYGRLDVHNRSEAIAAATRMGIVD